MEDTRDAAQRSSAEGWGPVIGIAIIVALLIMGGIYFFMRGSGAGVQVPAIGAGRA